MMYLYMYMYILNYIAQQMIHATYITCKVLDFDDGNSSVIVLVGH